MTHTGVQRWRLPAMLGAVVLIAAGCTGSNGTHRAASAANASPAIPATASASIAPTVSTAPSASSDGAADAPCTYKLITRDLPTWARVGFHGPPFNVWPYVTSSRGDIVGVLFGSILAPPPSANEEQNKILWVSKNPEAGALSVQGHLIGTSENVDIGDISSFGPSLVDVPKPGCWRFTLHWNGPTETVDIVYGAR
jgi:hypothetical protein